MNWTNTYLVSSIIAIIGLMIMVVNQQTSYPISQAIKPFLDQVSSLLFISGTLSVLYKKFIDESQQEEIKKILKIHNSLQESGFVEYRPKHNEYNFAELINDSEELTFILNDGLSWIKHNAGDLRNRFNKKHTITVFYQVDPDGDFIPAISKKVSYSLDDYKKKLDTAKTELVKLYEESNKKGSLEIYRLRTFPTQSIFLTEKKLIITPYTIASKRGNVPVLIYDATIPEKGMLKIIKEDLINIKSESKQVLSLGGPEN